MAKKLPPIPKPTKAKVGPARGRKAESSAEAPAGPSLAHIAEQLRPLAVPCESVQFDPHNARLHPEDNLESIRGSVTVYGQRRPIVVNRRTGRVEAGNGLLQAMLSLGHSHIAAVFVDEDQAAANGYALADNRASDLAGWDKAKLDALLRDVNTGNDDRLDAMLADLAKEQKLYPAADTAPDQNAETSPDEPPPAEEPTAALKCPACGHQFPAAEAA